MKRLNNILVICFICLLVTGCQKNDMVAYSREFYAMDTIINVRVWSDNQAIAQHALNGVEDVFYNIHTLTSRYKEQLPNPALSDVYQINANAGQQSVAVSADTFYMIEQSLLWSKRSGGAFNILLGPVMDLWGFGTNNKKIPSEEELHKMLDFTNEDDIVLDQEQQTVFLSKEGMLMDLGGVAKGYATDKAIQCLQKNGIQIGVINAGGNVYCLGVKPDGSQWQVGVKAPTTDNDLLGLANAPNMALISSGDYQRFFEVDGVVYHHILNPDNGMPARKSRATTVITPSAIKGDIWSTLLFVLGPEEGSKFFQQWAEPEDAALFVDGDKNIYSVGRLQDYFTLFENIDYKLQ